jgi:hypothetical protein
MTLEHQLRLSLIYMELLRIASSLDGRSARIVRYAARVLSLLGAAR